MRAWVFQDYRQRKKLGEKAAWSVGWIDPKGKRRSKTIGSKSRADKFARKIEGELAAGTYQSYAHKLWSDFPQRLRSQDVTLSADQNPGGHQSDADPLRATNQARPRFDHHDGRH